MTPHYADDWLTVYAGDALTVLRDLDASSVHCVVTSPPYWGLRDYGTATWIGGDEGCDHGRGFWAGSTAHQMAVAMSQRRCKCGATRQDSQLGLEATPEEYVANLVAVFREVRRVLRDDGTLWLNLGDSYARNAGKGEKFRGGRLGADLNGSRSGVARMEIPLGLKEKDLVGIPWRVAFALQADGWYLRSDIIWAKPNPMPESVTDRPTKAHEYLFLLSKSARYYYDADAVAERSMDPVGTHRGGSLVSAANGRNGDPLVSAHNHGGGIESLLSTGTRNLRSVWTIATRPYPGAHFAVFPPELPERCIKAGCPEGGVVLDPFAGSGTVGLVANRLSRRAILIDLNPAYIEQQMKRNAQVPVGL